MPISPYQETLEGKHAAKDPSTFLYFCQYKNPSVFLVF